MLAVPLLLFLLRFVWQVFLAPSEIVYLMLQPIVEGGQIYGVAVATNSAIWKRKKSYSAGEFAALLDGMDPSSPASTINSKSYLTLILDDLRAGSLKCSRPLGMGSNGTYYPDMAAILDKDAAIAWAEAHEFGKVVAPLRD